MFNESHNDDNIDYYRPERVLRSEDKVKIKSKFTRITKVQKSPFYRGVGLWNDLPMALQHKQSKPLFKKAINKLNLTLLWLWNIDSPLPLCILKAEISRV